MFVYKLRDYNRKIKLQKLILKVSHYSYISSKYDIRQEYFKLFLHKRERIPIQKFKKIVAHNNCSVDIFNKEITKFVEQLHHIKFDFLIDV